MATQSTLSFGLEGKRVVITGAGGDLGRALVSAFRKAGALIIACDRDAALLDALPSDGIVERHVFEMTDRVAVQAAGRAIATPDILVNNAGFTRADNFSIVNEEVVTNEIQINLSGVIDFTRALLPAMVGRDNSSIVFISSVNALLHCGNPIYSVAKAGQLAFARALAVEYGSKGIRANAVCPGSMLTRAWEQRIAARPDLVDEVAKHYPRGHLILPEEVAHTVMFLASPLASAITGVEVPVDAGFRAGNVRFVRDIIGFE